MTRHMAVGSASACREVKKMMAGCLRVCVLLSVLYALVSADSSSVNEKCRHNLTRYDPYLSQYIGKR